ncbi:hypothetical protein QBC45DRAFT_103839 [Copromyces sp. CBS 386.78]|nr:hypothetical protein QBC45DRAFT_103839 [Copromyces sp. CBS 386.78]
MDASSRSPLTRPERSEVGHRTKVETNPNPTRPVRFLQIIEPLCHHRRATHVFPSAYKFQGSMASRQFHSHSVRGADPELRSSLHQAERPRAARRGRAKAERGLHVLCQDQRPLNRGFLIASRYTCDAGSSC